MNLVKNLKLASRDQLESWLDYVRESGWEVTKQDHGDLVEYTSSDCPWYGTDTPLASSVLSNDRWVHYACIRLIRKKDGS